MPTKHILIAALIGWAIAAFLPPGKVLSMFKGKGGPY